MLILPAIDIRGGRCVRLLQGDYDQETVFGDDPAEMARRWLSEGAEAIHIVDLDGAREGKTENRDAVSAILAEVARFEKDRGEDAGIVTELGGGIRDLASVEDWVDRGLSRVILGTAAVRNPTLVDEAASRFPGRVWVGIDARDGRVAVDGWLDGTDRSATELAKEVEGRGAAGVIYTDIARDGTGDGVNAESTAALAAGLDIPVVASGGVRDATDVTRVREVADAGVEGIIVGRALYDGAVTMAELLSAATL